MVVTAQIRTEKGFDGNFIRTVGKILTHVGTNTIDTEWLTLRRFTLDDTAAVLRNWAADERVQKMYGEPVYPDEEAVQGLLEKYIGEYERPDYYRWAIVLEGQCIGQIAYFLVDSRNHFAEIEYCIGRNFQSKGYATEATRAVIRYGFEEINLHKVQICHRPENLSSKRVIEKCRFTYEGALRDYFYMDGGYEDRLYYSILRDEYFGGDAANTLR